MLRDLDDGTSVGSDTWPQVGTLLGYRSSDGRTLHVTLGVDNDTSRVFKVEEDSIAPSPGLSLSDYNGGHDWRG